MNNRNIFLVVLEAGRPTRSINKTKCDTCLQHHYETENIRNFKAPESTEKELKYQGSSQHQCKPMDVKSSGKGGLRNYVKKKKKEEHNRGLK